MFALRRFFYPYYSEGSEKAKEQRSLGDKGENGKRVKSEGGKGKGTKRQGSMICKYADLVIRICVNLRIGKRRRGEKVRFNDL